jgi:hypothetical protein
MAEHKPVLVQPKSWVKSKTLWTSVAGTVTGIGMFVGTGNPEALVTSGFSLVQFFLRLATKQPIE